MKLVASVEKSFKENIRDWKVLVMVLLFSPFFLLLMYLFYGGEPTAYKIGVLNYDEGKSSVDLIKKLENIEGPEIYGTYMLTHINSEDQLKKEVKEKTIDVGIIIPSDYSKKLESQANNTLNPSIVNFYGSIGNIRYTVAAIMTADVINEHSKEAAKIILPSSIAETFLEEKQPLNEFDGYVPGIISLAILMILFTATASIVKENDKNTLIRIKLSRLGAFHFLAGVSIVQALVALVALILSYLAALGLGYEPAGSFGAMLFVGIISSFSIVAVSLIVASFLKTVFDVLTIGCFPFFILMFFSGSMFPMPKVNLFMVGGHPFGITDILPLTHTANAFNKILNYGAGINQIWVDIFMIVLLTVIYFIIGLILYQIKKLSKA